MTIGQIMQIALMCTGAVVLLAVAPFAGVPEWASLPGNPPQGKAGTGEETTCHQCRPEVAGGCGGDEGVPPNRWRVSSGTEV